jgi:iron-sulfur cluster repair protein YtfE (RIC family)
LGRLGSMDRYARHHAYLERELPFLAELALRVRGVHTATDQQLSDVVSVLARVRAELEAHVTLQQRVAVHPWSRYEADLLERHARELEAELATLAALTGGFRADRPLSDDHRLLVTRLGALAADTRRHLRSERELMLPVLTPLSAA